MLDIGGKNKNKRRVEVLLNDIPFEYFFSSVSRGRMFRSVNLFKGGYW
jgi:hypothetical protein